MINTICAALCSTESYAWYLTLKKEKHKVLFCVMQLYIFFYAIASILVHLIGGLNAVLIFFTYYISIVICCIKTAKEEE